MHHDHFREGESLESKSAFTVPVGRNGSLGRGGSVLGNQFVWVIQLRNACCKFSLSCLSRLAPFSVSSDDIRLKCFD